MILFCFGIKIKGLIFFFFFGVVGGKAKPLKQPKAEKKDYDEVWFSISCNFFEFVFFKVCWFDGLVIYLGTRVEKRFKLVEIEVF